MKKHSKRRLIFNFIITFAGFFLFSGSSIIICFLFLLHEFNLPLSSIKSTAPATIMILLLISSIFAIIGTLWKKITVESPVHHINQALIRIKKGDFSQKLKRRFYPARYATIVNIVNMISEELSSIENLKISLMSNISHELKTPISVINNYSIILQDENLSDEKRIEYANAISDSAKKMSELITNILKLNQLENQKIPFEMVEYNLTEQLCESLLPFEDLWDNKNIEIVTDLQEDVFIKSDFQLMNIVWNNLFSNAIKFTPENGTVSLKLTESRRFAVVCISDTGCGIPEDQQEMIFEKFYQCDTSRATEGNGLGLALVKRIINITNSMIKVESKIDEGTTFTIKIPKN